MSRKFFYAIFFSSFLVIFALYAQLAKAQTTPPTTDRTSGSSTTTSPACNQVAWSCAQVTDLDAGKQNTAHRIQLKQSGLPPKDPAGNPTKFYVACGIETDEGFLMTTGNATHDQNLCLGKDTYKKLQNKVDYRLNLMSTSNPFTSSDGSMNITVEPSNAGDSRHHMCMIGWEIPVTTTGSSEAEPDSNSASDTSYGLEYTSFTFASDVAACTTVYADPFGRTYNKQLKPVPGAKVSIFDFDSKSLMNIPGLPNPVTTEETGIFNFNIPPGRSYLQTNLTNTPVDVHPNYKLAYTEPYTYGNMILETLGKAEQRDIPVSGGSQPVLKLMAYSHVRTGNTIHIQGIASWPLTIVDIMQGSTSISQQQADKFGNFTFQLDPMRIDPTKQLTVKLTEVDLTVNPKAAAPNPATDSITFDPIPSYLEGYAYDAKGKLLPFATIRIKLNVSDGIYYQTKADQAGFYSVAPRNLPILPYYLEIIPANSLPGQGTLPTGSTTLPTGVTGGTEGTGGTNTSTTAGTVSKITIPVYARQNKEYHDTQVVNIMSGTKNGTKVDPSAVASASDAVFGTPGTRGNAEDQNARNGIQKKSRFADQATSGQNYITLLILVALLIFVGSAAVIFIRKRSHESLGRSSQNVYTRDTDVTNPKDE